MVEQLTLNQRVAGSSPARFTIALDNLSEFNLLILFERIRFPEVSPFGSKISATRSFAPPVHKQMFLGHTTVVVLQEQ